MDYAHLLDAAKQNPAQADFHALRMAYTRSPDYHPYAHPLEPVERLRAALHTQDFPTALNAVQEMLEDSYCDIEAHMSADYIYLQMGNEKRSAFHRAFGQGLLHAIWGTGDGRSFETAFIVIDIQEEYLLCRLMGLVPRGQALTNHEGHWFDVLDMQSGDKLYFNIDLPRQWLDKQF
jgi:hypothetical protein